MSAPMQASRHSMLRRVIAATGSNAYNQATTIAIQLASLPLFLSKWGLATYGEWMVLSAIPSYLAMADVGMVTAAGNRMTMLHAEGDLRGANHVFQSALAFMLAVALAAIALTVGVVAWWPFPGMASFQSRAAILVLSIGVVVSLLGGLPEAVYKATHRYALGTAFSNTIRLFEWLGGLAGLWWGGDFVSVALGALLPRAAFTLAMTIHAARSTPEFRWGFDAASRAEIRHCAGPALSFMAFPAANALSFQGMTLIAAATLGPAGTVVFNTYRTMARVTVQATATFSHALWPEFSRLFGRRDLSALGTLVRRSNRLGWALAAVASVGIYLVAPFVLRHWSKGQIAFLPPLMLIAMGYAAAAGAWHVARVLLLATNQHRGLAGPFLLASAAVLPLAWTLAKSFGLVGIMASMLVLELGMWGWCGLLSRRLLAPIGKAPAGVGVAA